MADLHRVYDFMYSARYAGTPLHIVRAPTTYLDIPRPRLLNGVILALSHCCVAAGILAGVASGRRIIVREFNNLHFLLIVPLVWWFRNRMLLNINHNVTYPLGRGSRATAFRLLSRLGFRFMLLDGDRVKPELERAFRGIRLLTPRFCVPARMSAQRRAPAHDVLQIGVIGDFRLEKGGLDALASSAKALARVPGISFIVGARNAAVAASAAGLGIAVRSTRLESEYDAFLAQCDAILLLASKEHYFVRHSGVLIDGLGLGIPMIVPDYPIFSAIISNPAQVGLTYRDHADLERAAAELRRKFGELRENFRVYHAQRNVSQFEQGLIP